MTIKSGKLDGNGPHPAIQISSAKEARGRYMAIADTHVRAFYGSTIRRSEFWNTLLRLDRVMTLDDGRGRSNVDCLVACVDFDDGKADMPLDENRSPLENSSNSDNWVLSLLERALSGDGATAREHVIGAVTIDGNYLREKGRNHRHAYIANLAVDPGYRRQGIAERLMLEAEGRAREFGCTRAMLHVDERNAAGWRLYRKLGYRTVSRQQWWEALLEGRGEGERLVLLLKNIR